MVSELLKDKYLDRVRLESYIQNWLDKKAKIWKEIMKTNFLYDEGFRVLAISGKIYISWPRLEEEQEIVPKEIDEFDAAKYREELKSELIAEHEEEIAALNEIIKQIRGK